MQHPHVIIGILVTVLVLELFLVLPYIFYMFKARKRLSTHHVRTLEVLKRDPTIQITPYILEGKLKYLLDGELDSFIERTLFAKSLLRKYATKLVVVAGISAFAIAVFSSHVERILVEIIRYIEISF